jgi:uncharacterized protein YndB with AHSA1/START domain
VAEVKRERTVQASRDDVWRLVSDPFHLPRWWPATARVEDASGDAWTSVLRTPSGKTVRADFTRLETEAPRRLSWRQELEESPFERVFSSAVTVIDLEDAGDGATVVRLTAVEKLRGRYRLGGWLVRRAARRRLDDALAGLERAVAPE